MDGQGGRYRAVLWLAASVLGSAVLGAEPAHAQSETPAGASPAAQTEVETAIGTLLLPVLVEGQPYGQATASVSMTAILRINPAELADALGGIMDDAALSRLRAIGREPVDVAAVEETGLGIQFDNRTLSIKVSMPLAQRRARVYGGEAVRLQGGEAVHPSRFAVGVTGALISSTQLDGDRASDHRLILSGFANLGGMRGINLLYGGDVEDSDQGLNWRRGRMVAFYDRPEQALRISAGDVQPYQMRMSGAVDLLGVSVERNYQSLQPMRNIRSVARRSVLLERRSTVQVYVNDVLVQTFMADPGPIDLRDIPLAQLSNNVSILVEDDLGRREVENFQVGADLSLLEEGISEFSVSAGVQREGQGGSLSYGDDALVSAYYTRGLSNGITAAMQGLATREYLALGSAATLVAWRGIVSAELAVSHTDLAGSGGLFGVTYRGDVVGGEARDGVGEQQFSMRAEYRTQDFRELGMTAADNGLRFDITGDYRLRLSRETTASLGASWQSVYGPNQDRYSLFAGLTRSFGPVGASATARYQRMTGLGDEFGLYLTLSTRFGRRGTAYASYDSLNETARAEYRLQREMNYPASEFALRVQKRREEFELGGRAAYETTLYSASADVVQMRRDGEMSELAAVRFQSGLAYVDGRLGVGRDPGAGFLMVSRHPSLRDSRINVSFAAQDNIMGRAGRLGPAVVSLTSPYRAQEVSIRPLNLPVGYDIGAGTYSVRPGAVSGLSIVVGHDAYRTVMARISDAEGQAVSLRYGRLHHVQSDTTVSFFTNAQGRAVFNRLRPGQYRLEISGKGQYAFTIAPDAAALVDLGPIRLAEVE